MKKLIIMLGPNGVGKSTVSAELLHLMDHSAYVDSDTLRMVNPNGSTSELAAVQKANILAVINNYLSSDLVNHVIFPYGLHGHRKKMLDDIIDDLSGKFDIVIHKIVLTCSEEENIRRMKHDGRDAQRIQRALEFSRPMFDRTEYQTIDTTELTPKETAQAILDLLM